MASSSSLSNWSEGSAFEQTDFPHRLPTILANRLLVNSNDEPVVENCSVKLLCLDVNWDDMIIGYLRERPPDASRSAVELRPEAG